MINFEINIFKRQIANIISKYLFGMDQILLRYTMILKNKVIFQHKYLNR